MASSQSSRLQCYNLNALWEICRYFTREASPVLYSITMGTGKISILFFAFPFCTGAQPKIVLSLIFFFLGLFLYCSFTIILCIKYVCHPDRWSSLWRSPTASMYAGCFPMGAATLINVAVIVINGQLNYGGKLFFYSIWAIWWLDVLISFMCCWVGVHTMITLQKHSLDSMTARWLLPVMTLMVASASGGILGGAIRVYSQLHSFQTLLVSVFMVSVGFTLTLMILTIYLMRLFLHGLPPDAKVLSVFLPIGPTSQSGYTILLIGQNFHKLLPFPPHWQSSEFFNYSSTGTIVEVVCTCGSFILWSLATMWILYALLAMYSGVRSKIPFKAASFWGLVFPNGVYANLTIQLGDTFNSTTFRVFGSFYAACTLVLWLGISIRSFLELKNLASVSRNSLLPHKATPRGHHGGEGGFNTI